MIAINVSYNWVDISLSLGLVSKKSLKDTRKFINLLDKTDLFGGTFLHQTVEARINLSQN